MVDYLYYFFLPIGFVLGVSAAYVSSFRSVKQPIAYDITAERFVVNSVIKNPVLFFRVRDLEVNMFADKEAADLWRIIQDNGKKFPTLNQGKEPTLLTLRAYISIALLLIFSVLHYSVQEWFDTHIDNQKLYLLFLFLPVYALVLFCVLGVIYLNNRRKSNLSSEEKRERDNQSICNDSLRSNDFKYFNAAVSSLPLLFINEDDLHVFLKGVRDATKPISMNTKLVDNISNVDNKDEDPNQSDEVLAASRVHDYYQDRTKFNGGSKIVEGPDSERPLVRVRRVLSFRRGLLTGILLMFMSFVSVYTAKYSLSSEVSILLGSLALLALSFFSVVWALVDWDTFLLDFNNFILGSIISGSITVLALLRDSHWERLIKGGLLSIGVAVALFVANKLFKFLLSIDGMGIGDSYIVAITAGIPTAITGDLLTGFWCFMGSLLLGVLGWVVLFLLGKVKLSTPYAFGPYLALGWVIPAFYMV